MGFRLYNTLTRTVEPFEPLHPPRVTMYVCGPTVRNYAHIGNFRTFVLGDLLRRYLEYSGYEVFQVMNLTDVDDRTIEAAAAAGVALSEYTAPFIDAFFEDCDYFRVKPAHHYPRATAYAAPMVELVNALLEKGLAYRGDDGSIYYQIHKFADYGRLSRVDRRELRAGARVASDEYAKEDARDFALWKAAAPVDEQVGAAWDAPFGRGRPGWHLECSAMALSELRRRFGIETLDIHAGAVDLIFPHHENEIAQSEAATGQPFARFWVHGEFLTVSGTKMSKRFGNFLTGQDLREEGVDPASLRLLMFNTHYRQQLNFSDDALDAAAEGVQRLSELRQRLAEAAEAADAEADSASEAVETLEAGFRAALDDDLNAPKAVGSVFNFVRSAHRAMDRIVWGAPEARRALEAFDRVMDVLDLLPAPVVVPDELQRWVEERIEARQAARAARDFATADAVREELAARGVELEDTPQGTRWKLGAG